MRITSSAMASIQRLRTDAAAVTGLGNSTLGYALDEILPVLDAYATGGTATVGGLLWQPGSAPTGNPGDVIPGAGTYTLVMDNGTGMIGAPPRPQDDEIPEPVTLALTGLALTALGGYVRRRRTA